MSEEGKAFYDQALTAYNQGKTEEAIELFRKALAAGHNPSSTHYNIGTLLNALGKDVEAVEHYDQSLLLDPNSANTLENRANSLMMLGRIEESIVGYQKAFDIDKRAKAIAAAGYMLEFLGKEDEAMQCYNDALKHEPKNFKAVYYKGSLLLEKGKLEEAIPYFKTSLEIVAGHPGALYRLGNISMKLGKESEALEYYRKGCEHNSTLVLHFCNRGRCFLALGKKKEAMDDFKKIQEMFDTNKTGMLFPQQKKMIQDCLKSVFEAEDIAVKAEAAVSSLDQSKPVVQKFVQNLKKLQEQKDKAQAKIMNNIEKGENAQHTENKTELEKIKEEFKKQLAEVQKEVTTLKTQVKNIDERVTNVENNVESLKEEVANKMDDFNKKLDSELQKQDLSPGDQAKLKGYFKAFVETFSSMHVTAQVVDSGQVQLDSDSSTATALSFVASFAPFIGNSLASGIKSIGEFLKSKEMKTNARKMKRLASDATQLSQLIGKTGYEIVMNKTKQSQILQATEESLAEVSKNVFQKLAKFCEDLEEKIDVYLYSDLYKTCAERLGHKDANELIEKWVKAVITPYDIEKQFIDQILNPNAKIEQQSPDSHEKVHSGRSSCCTMF